MKEQIISLEAAKLAKEKGFNIECEYFYNSGSRYKLQYDSLIRTGEGIIIEAPSQSLLAKWLREVHNIILISEWDFGYRFVIYIDDGRQDVSPISTSNFSYFNTYEEALESGLLSALKLIK